MANSTVKGKIAFINHEKKYAIIEYEQNGKKKTVHGSIEEKVQKKLKAENIIKKTHHFMMGDVVECKVGISERGDRMIASNIRFLYNNALDVLINRSNTTNKFTGYLKIVDDKYFVKEIESYLFFPVPFSPWQILPTESELNEPVLFSLENRDKKEKISASLLSNVYIPEFHHAVRSFKNKQPLEAEVYNITPHGIYINVFEEKIRAKIPLLKSETISLSATLKKGDKIMIIITHLSKSRISVEPVTAQ